MLTTGQCARYMGVSSSYVLQDIEEGILIADNVGRPGHKRDYRIFFPNFVAYLHTRRWSRIPSDVTEVLAA